MVSRSDKYEHESNEINSRVVKNQELYQELYNENYLQEEKNSSLEKTTEIDIEKVHELLRGRETYRKEMKMREYNILKKEEAANEDDLPKEEKNYDINDYLNKAAHEKEYQPYHKIDVEPLGEIEETEEDDSVQNLENMGNTELSLNMFGALQEAEDDEEIEEIEDDSEESEEYEETEEDEEDEAEIEESDETEESDEIEESDETEEFDEADSAFFTGSIKIHYADSEDDEEVPENSSKFIKILMVILVLIIAGLVAFLLFM